MEGIEQLPEILRLASGYIYPNEAELHWGFLVVIYPYLTGLVAGAFILASLVKVFNVKALLPTYRLSMLTALSFLIVAPLPLLAHLGHPERSLQIFLTPQPKSAMAMFGFVYAWYLMMVLLAEIWLEYRIVLIEKGRTKKGLKKLFYKFVSLWDTDTSKKSIIFDHKAIHFITLVGIPSAFLLHGYVGFIFGAIKANPWWSSVLMPVVFLFSAIVSGIALVLILYTLTSLFKSRPIDMKCLEKLAAFLLYALLVDFSLEMLDFIHRLYESEESIEILGHMITNRLFISLIIVQMLLGTIIPLITLSILHIKKDMPVEFRRLGYLIAAVLIQMGIFSTRWNVVVGGQLFSKSLRGLTIYKVEMLGTEGLFMGILLLVLPLIILYFVAKILPMWQDDPVVDSGTK
ncbi:MAG: polysulfide reductase NrfD [Calditrichaeota bacterium]|nr:polysulfide reductase NrfD [Calditrichota bacterium]MBT7789404.1 polysulfide reductase NrfD [Calditrichota bacterium]